MLDEGCIDEISYIDRVRELSHLFYHFQKTVHSFQVGPKFGYKFEVFGKCSTGILAKWFVCNQVTSFNLQVIWADFGAFQLIKITHLFVVFGSLCFGPCGLVTCA